MNSWSCRADVEEFSWGFGFLEGFRLTACYEASGLRIEGLSYYLL